MQERVDYGMAAVQMQLAGGKLVDYLPYWWSRKDAMDDDALWSMLGAMAERKYPEVKPRGGKHA